MLAKLSYWMRGCMWLMFVIPTLIILSLWQYFTDRDAFKRGDIL